LAAGLSWWAGVDLGSQEHKVHLVQGMAKQAEIPPRGREAAGGEIHRRSIKSWLGWRGGVAIECSVSLGRRTRKQGQKIQGSDLLNCGFHAWEFLLRSVVSVKSLWAAKGQTHTGTWGEKSCWWLLNMADGCGSGSLGTAGVGKFSGRSWEVVLYACPALAFFPVRLLWGPSGDGIVHRQAGFVPAACCYSAGRTLQ